jgi:hypothetical protein
MSYENAPAVNLVATACCVCGRPLLDAESLATGIGPVCAEKTGYGREALEPAVRSEVNRLVFELAAFGRDVRAVPRLMRLRVLGFAALALRIEERLAELVEVWTAIVEGSDPVRVYAEFPRVEDRNAFEALVADLRRVPGRRYEEVVGVGPRNTFPRTKPASAAFRELLARHFPGRVVRGLKGLYVVEAEESGTAAA